MRQYEHSKVSEITDYASADAKLHNKAGNPVDSRKVGNNTYLERRHDPSGETYKIVLRLHATDVVTFWPSGNVELDTGSWYTVTTKDRMNKWLPPPFSIFSKRGTWHVTIRMTTVHRDYEWNDIPVQHYCGDYRCHEAPDFDRSVPYFDGIILDPKTQTVVNGSEIPDEKARDKRNAKMRKAIASYVKLYTDERIAELVDNPDMASGDCFYCLMVRSNPDSREIPTDHYLVHFKEKYTMLSTIFAAVGNRGNPWFVLRVAPDLARRDLSRYLRKALLEATMVNH